ncbi:MAG: rane protein of unknown function [Nitrososphaeraceae archaeon]|nr:rane protein of unknown function [Nitrososphaeraceae archaeon]
MESIKTSYYKYRNIILFNKNLILAGIIAAVADIFIVNYASSIFVSNYLIISGISLVGDFLIYNILFIAFYFFDNRSQYINSYGIKKKQKIKQDLKKLIAVIGFAEISYLTTKFFSTFIIFELFLENPSLISIITTLLAWILYITIANIMAENQKLFN